VPSNHLLAFDEGPEAERMRRYELTCHRFVFQTGPRGTERGVHVSF
jgi:hypothetical protein